MKARALTTHCTAARSFNDLTCNPLVAVIRSEFGYPVRDGAMWGEIEAGWRRTTSGGLHACAVTRPSSAPTVPEGHQDSGGAPGSSAMSPRLPLSHSCFLCDRSPCTCHGDGRVLLFGHLRLMIIRRFSSAESQEGSMDNTTILIIILVVVLLAGGGWYGRGRWY